MPLTAAYRNKVGDHLIGQADIGALGDLWVGLSTSNPGDAGSFAGEPSGGGYGRINVTAALGAFADTGLGYSEATNESEISFGTPGADWGTGAYVFFAKSQSGTAADDMVYYQAIPSPRAMGANSAPVKFNAGRLKIRHT
jgi:hypothetical protein